MDCPTKQRENKELARILFGMVEGGGEDRNKNIYADDYQAGDGDTFVYRAAEVLVEQDAEIDMLLATINLLSDKIAAAPVQPTTCEHCNTHFPLHLLTCPVSVKGMAEDKKKEAPEPLRQLLIDLSNNTYFCGLHLADDAKYATYLREAEKAEQALIELFERAAVQPVAVPAEVQDMADCMHMVRQELIEAGVIDASVPPMMIADAVVAKLAAAPSPAAVDGAKGEQQVDDVMPPFAAPASQHGASIGDWISVEAEHKPEPRMPVLLAVRTLMRGEDDDGRPYETEGAEVAMGEYRLNNGAPYFDCYTSPMSDNDWITHWMPLPPKPDQCQPAGAAKGGNTSDKASPEEIDKFEAVCPEVYTDAERELLWKGWQLRLATQAPAIAADRDAVLEEAAQLCESEICACCWKDGAEDAALYLAEEIRALKSTSSAASRTNGSEHE